ncbi:putative DEAD-box ATP-dependent RNA helicase 48 [Platanthera zijinensis]|uniref:DEAD-box ATP-dependent RNA helicase 48 n=1 Tax=Platanthera zijinensis TaxID=2320716 RepID=A0AAP0BXA7_9ASPA
MSSSLRHHSKSLHKILCNLSLIRSMGGGPRTFPGGLSKWQYKRMHEKLAREKEQRLLQQEKQIYQARLRSEIRAKVAGKSTSNDYPGASAPAGRMSSKDHIKSLADRFMKQGAEDLWNKDDGPIRTKTNPRPPNLPPPRPLDLRKTGSEKRGSIGSLEHRRHFSRWSRNTSSDEDEVGESDSVSHSESGLLKNFWSRDGRAVEDLRSPRFSIGSQNYEKDRKKMSGAALRNYDVKMNKRRAPRPDIEESQLSEEIKEFRQEMRNRASVETGINQQAVNEGSILTQKRS